MKGFLLALTIMVLGCGVSLAGEPSDKPSSLTAPLPPASPRRWVRTKEPTQASTAQSPRTTRRRLNGLNVRISRATTPSLNRSTTGEKNGRRLRPGAPFRLLAKVSPSTSELLGDEIVVTPRGYSAPSSQQGARAKNFCGGLASPKPVCPSFTTKCCTRRPAPQTRSFRTSVARLAVITSRVLPDNPASPSRPIKPSHPQSKSRSTAWSRSVVVALA